MSDVFTLCDLTFDISRFSDETRDYMSPHSQKAKQTLTSWIKGEAVNRTENREAMHMALRANGQSPLPKRFIDPVLIERARMQEFVEKCQATHIVHIGVGGSDFGPRLVTHALSTIHKPERDIRFLSSLTPEAIDRTMQGLPIDTTLFVLASKSFTTDETVFLYNSLKNHYHVPHDQFISLTAFPEKAIEAGFDPDKIFKLWGWVGGRYSLWSSIGISIALTYGWSVFEDLLKGARMIDHALIEEKSESKIWTIAQMLQAERVIHNRVGLALLPYHDGLNLLSTYAQQLIMESNGKPHDSHASSIVFGNTGTEFQHSFGQFLHQGPDITTSIFITVHNEYHQEWQKTAQNRLHANARAQADTLWLGKINSESYKNITGKRPALMIDMPTLDAVHMGSLLAFFEHITVIDAFLMDINPFDQWGVEAGKIMARDLLKSVD